MAEEKPPEMRNWRARLTTRVVHFYFSFTRGMTLGVRAACFDAQGRVFLVKHSYIPGWHMPGGGMERSETAHQALAKELREEGNLVMSERPELFHVYYNRQTSKRDHVLFYRCRNVSQTGPKFPDSEILESGFFALENLPADTTTATRRRLAELRGLSPASDYW